MDKASMRTIFDNYLSNYQWQNPQIQMKKKHTYRVADLSYEIAKSTSRDMEGYADLCWFIGLLHDIGRFEQLKRYGTFLDAESIDHAELGADILFKEGIIEQFYQDSFTDMEVNREREIIELSIKNHNKYRIQDDLDDKQRYFCNVIRDADKIDIFRVICETPYEERMSKKQKQSLEPARDGIMNCIKNHSSVKTMDNMTRFESTIMGCAMGFDIVFDKSKEIVKRQGYLKQMLLYEPESSRQRYQMKMLRKELLFLC